MFEYEDEAEDIAALITELSGGRVLPLIEEPVDYDVDV